MLLIAPEGCYDGVRTSLFMHYIWWDSCPGVDLWDWDRDSFLVKGKTRSRFGDVNGTRHTGERVCFELPFLSFLSRQHFGHSSYMEYRFIASLSVSDIVFISGLTNHTWRHIEYTFFEDLRCKLRDQKSAKNHEHMVMKFIQNGRLSVKYHL